MDRKRTLNLFFKDYLNALQNTQDYRKATSNIANQYLQENLEDLKSQISLTNAKVEAQFDKKYGEALKALQEAGMTATTFNRLSSTLRATFLNHFVNLKDIGIETGHIVSNLALASKEYAQKTVFVGKEVSEFDPLDPNYLQDLAKGLALLSIFNELLSEIDSIQNRQQLIAFLKKGSRFKKLSRGTDLSSIDSIKKVVADSYFSGKGFADLAADIFTNVTASVEIESFAEIKRSIVSTESTAAVSYEIRAFNKIKGTLSKEIKSQFMRTFSQFIENPAADNKILAELNSAFEKASIKKLTEKEFLELFPKGSSSKTLEEVIEHSIRAALLGKKNSPYNHESSPRKGTIKTPKQVKTVKAKPISTAKSKKKGPLVVPFDTGGLAALEKLLNSLLVLKVKENMGNGSRKDILNLRSGRFAESVKVERLSQSREGMITAFYSYMKNPYQTFEPGFRQGIPKSRDPKLLISKSIRELAAQKAVTKLRAVRV